MHSGWFALQLHKSPFLISFMSNPNVFPIKNTWNRLRQLLCEFKASRQRAFQRSGVFRDLAPPNWKRAQREQPLALIWLDLASLR